MRQSDRYLSQFGFSEQTVNDSCSISKSFKNISGHGFKCLSGGGGGGTSENVVRSYACLCLIFGVKKMNNSILEGHVSHINVLNETVCLANCSFLRCLLNKFREHWVAE